MESHLRAEMVPGVPNHATIKILIRTNRLKFLSRSRNRFGIRVRFAWLAPAENKKKGRETIPCPELITPKMTDTSGDQLPAKQPHRGQCGAEQHHSHAAIWNIGVSACKKRE